MSEKYNGWTNYETWCVNLWIDNDGTAEPYRELALCAVANTANEQCPDGAAIRTLAEQIKEEFETGRDETCETPGVYGDLLGAALSSVNWSEIARHYIDAAKEEVNDA
jgi:hypothetical protein